MATRTRRGALAFGFLATAIGLAAVDDAARAQAPAGAASTPSTPPDPFTLQNLIGDAVSLSNQQYPDVDKAIGRFKNGDAAGARGYLDQARKQFPKLPPTEVTMAKLHLYANDGPNGRVYLEQAVQKYPNDPESYLLMADLAYTEGRTTEAGALFDIADGLVQKFNENEKRKKNFEIRVLAGKGAVLERRLKWDEAQALYAKWVQIDPDSSSAHTRLGIALARLKKSAEAFEEFKKARELKTDSLHPYVMLGQIHTQDNQIPEAKTAFEKAYKEEPTNEATARSYTEWLIQQGELDKAQTVTKAMRQAAPTSLVALTLDGVVAKMRNQPKEAEEALRKVLEIDPSNAGATNLLALILGESSNVDEQETALRFAQVNAERFPQNSQTNITLAWILFKLGRAQEGNTALQRGAAARNLNADTAYLVARILVQQNQKDSAKKALEQLLAQAGTGMFMYRKESEALLKELGGEVPKPPAPGTAPVPAAPINVGPDATGGAGATPGAGTSGAAPATPPAATPAAAPAADTPANK